MKIDENKGIRTFFVSLFISVSFFIFFPVYFKISLDAIGGIFLFYGTPLLILYILGLYLISIPEESKRNTVGWIIMSYAFLYMAFLNWYLSFMGVGGSCSNNEFSKSPHFVEDIIFGLNLTAIWYAFIIPIFLKYKMKRHLCGACISLLIIIAFLLYGAGIY